MKRTFTLYETEDGVWVVSINHIWFPGAYESAMLALLAAEKLTDEEAQALQDAVNPGGIITSHQFASVRDGAFIDRETWRK